MILFGLHRPRSPKYLNPNPEVPDHPHTRLSPILSPPVQGRSPPLPIDSPQPAAGIEDPTSSASAASSLLPPEAVNLLLEARSPLIVVGSKQCDDSTWEEVVKLARTYNFPLILTPLMAKRKCALSDQEINYAVVDENYGYAIRKCDVALVVCAEDNWKLHFEGLKMSFDKDRVKFIFLNVHREEIEHLKPHIGLFGEAKFILELINSELDSKGGQQFFSKLSPWVQAIHEVGHADSFFEDDDVEKQNERFIGYCSKANSYGSAMVPVCCQVLVLLYRRKLDMSSAYSVMLIFLLASYVVGFILNPAACYYHNNSKDKLKWNRICACLISLLRILAAYCQFIALFPKLHIAIKILIPVGLSVAYSGVFRVCQYWTGKSGEDTTNEDHDHISTMANSILGIALPGLITSSQIMAPDLANSNSQLVQPQLSPIRVVASSFFFIISLQAHVLLLGTTIRPRMDNLHLNSIYNLLLKCFMVGVFIVACGFLYSSGNPLSVVILIIVIFLINWHPVVDGAARQSPKSRYLDVLVVNLAGIILGVDGTLMYAARDRP